jgi:hypothetical protein
VENFAHLLDSGGLGKEMQKNRGKMPKILPVLILNFSFLLSEVVFAPSLRANPTSPIELNSEVEVPVCYMETDDGRRLDLRNLCSPPSEEVTRSCTSDSTGMPVTNVRYEGNSLRGQVTNRTCKTVTLIRVNYEVLDQQGKPIDNGFFSTQPSTITHGKTASFGGAIVPGYQINITYVEWSTG